MINMIMQTSTTTSTGGSDSALYLAAWLLAVGIYFLLLIKMFFVYKTSKMRTTLFFAGFFAFMAIGSCLGYWYTANLIENRTLTYIVEIIAVSFLAIAALEMIGKIKWWPLPALFAVIFTVLLLYIPYTDSLTSPLRTIGVLAIVLPVIVVFFFIFHDTHSGKSLGFAMGMLLMAIGMPIGKMIEHGGYDIAGICIILSALFVLAGLMGWIDKYVFKTAST